MNTGFNTIRDRVPINRFDKDDSTGEGDGGEASGDRDQDLLHEERSIKDKLTPNSRLQWLASFGGAILFVAFVGWIWPLIPPLFKTTEFALAMAIPVVALIVWLNTRRTMLSFWEQFDQVAIKKGSRAETIIGKVEESSGDNPLVKELKSVGLFGFSPEYRSIDDETTRDGALMEKIDRRNKDGSWEPARGKLDDAYTGDGEGNVFGRTYVADARETVPTHSSPGWEWKTLPPKKPDMDAARTIMTRDEILRNEVIPSYDERLTTMRERIEKVTTDMQESVLIPLEDIPELVTELQAQQPQVGRGHTGNGVKPEPTAPAAVDKATEEQLEEANDD